MTFAARLAARRSYTEAGIALKEALLGLPPEMITVAQVYAWLRDSGASPLILATCQQAATQYQYLEMRRTSRSGSAI
jgi:hypothetical protein